MLCEGNVVCTHKGGKCVACGRSVVCTHKKEEVLCAEGVLCACTRMERKSIVCRGSVMCKHKGGKSVMCEKTVVCMHMVHIRV